MTEDRISSYSWAKLQLLPAQTHADYLTWAFTLGYHRLGVPHISLAERGQVVAVPGLSLEARTREALFAVARELRAG